MKDFFDVVRSEFGTLSQSQVDGFVILINAAKGLPDRHAAYVLATAWHETARTMQPIYERGSRSYFDKYEFRKSLGNTLKGDGYRFRGVGYVQMTGRRNFSIFSKHLNVDLVANPELAAKPEMASKIMILGMRDGLFTGKKMADFTSFREMRRVVNGTDKADLIAGHAEKFLKAILAANAALPVTQRPSTVPEAPKTEETLPEAPKGRERPSLQKVMVWIVMALAAAIAALFGFGGN